MGGGASESHLELVFGLKAQLILSFDVSVSVVEVCVSCLVQWNQMERHWWSSERK